MKKPSFKQKGLRKLLVILNVTHTIHTSHVIHNSKLTSMLLLVFITYPRNAYSLIFYEFYPNRLTLHSHAFIFSNMCFIISNMCFNPLQRTKLLRNFDVVFFHDIHTVWCSSKKNLLVPVDALQFCHNLFYSYHTQRF